MVKNRLITFLISIFLPITSFAAEFIASLDYNQINAGDSFTLQLKLFDASPKGYPDISEIKKDFTILGKQELSNTTIINGNVSSSMSWQYRLAPKKEGKYTIPPIKIESSKGVLTSQQISLSVEKGLGTSTNSDNNIIFSASISKKTPYKNEPIIYTVRLTSQTNLVNVQFGDFSVDGCVIKTIGKPKVIERMNNGIPTKILEAKYIITPLKPGSVKIPGFFIQGQKVVQDKSPFDSVFGREENLFAILKGFQTLGIERLEPFTLTSDEIVLDVKNPPQSFSSWLPAESLKISESLPENQSFKVGEPFTRNFTIVGEGLTANQLPSLKGHQGKGAHVKIYEDTPITEENFKKDKLTSWREESYTLVPQQAGKLTLPEISVVWWNTKENKSAYAIIPERTIEIAPGAYTPPSFSQTYQSVKSKKSEDKTLVPAHTQTTQEGSQSNNVLYGIIGGLTLLLALTLLWILKLKKGTSPRETTKDRREPILTDEISKRMVSDANSKDLLKTNTPEELYHFLQAYGHGHWKAPQNASLEVLFATAKSHYADLSQEDIDFVVRNLQDALYAEKDVSLEKVKKRCLSLILSMKNSDKKERHKPKKLADLNPT